MLEPRNEIVHPRDHPVGDATFVGLEHIEPGTGRRIGSVPIRLEELTGRKARFHPGDIVYGYLRPYLNKVWVADFAGYCSVDQYVFRVGKGVVPEYVATYMRSPTFLANAPINETPGQLPRIRLDEVLDVPIDLPTEDAQRRTAVQVADQLAAVDQLRGKVSTATELAALRAQVRRVSFDLVGGPQVVLGHVLTASGAIIDGPFGSNLKGDHYQIHGVRVIRLGNIGTGSFIDSDQAYVSESHFQRLVRHAAIPGDVVVAALGDGARPAGRACLVPDDLAISMVKADCFRIRTSGSPLGGEYLMHYLNSPAVLEKLATASRGATRPRVTLEILRSLEIPLPSADEQERAAKDIRDRLRTIDVLESAMSAELNAIEALHAALLRRAFAHVAP
ncbi:MAG: restriction endonuclease subunit S [Candidatus Limnocylindrales bacterium]